MNEQVRHIILYPFSFFLSVLTSFKKSSLPGGLPRSESMAAFNCFWCVFLLHCSQFAWALLELVLHYRFMICCLLFIIPQVLRQTALCQDQIMFSICLQFRILLMLTLLMTAPRWSWNEWNLKTLVRDNSFSPCPLHTIRVTINLGNIFIRNNVK